VSDEQEPTIEYSSSSPGSTVDRVTVLTTPIVASPSSAAGSGSPPGAGTGADVTGGCSTTVVDGALG
jgi:hypothetical protein